MGGARRGEEMAGEMGCGNWTEDWGDGGGSGDWGVDGEGGVLCYSFGVVFMRC